VKVYLGLQHYVEDEKRYKQIRLVRGGGIREVYLPFSSTYKSILDLASEKFFKNGNSYMGSTKDMEFCLGNFASHVYVLPVYFCMFILSIH
jgi:hypothetical protein